VINTLVVWLHILGPYWCMCVELFGRSLLVYVTVTAEQRNIHTPIRT